MVNQAVETFGDLNILINNAGILRDKMAFNMDESDWDSVVDRPRQGPLRADAVRVRVLAAEGQGDGRARSTAA